MSVETIDYFVFKTDFPAFPNLQFLAVELLANFTNAAAAKSLQSCLTVQPLDGSPSGSAVPGILQARTLEWVAISFSNA